MNKKNNINAALLVVIMHFASLASPVLADEAENKAWSFEQLAQQALSHPSIQQSKSSEKSALADIESAKWQLWPVPGVQVNSKNMMRGDNNNNEGTVFSLEQKLWTGGRITSGIDGAEARHGFSVKSTRAVENTVLIDLTNAYIEAVRKQNHKNIQRDNVKQHERLLTMIERRVAQKISPQVDKELAQTRLFQAINELSYVTQSLNNALTRLSELTGYRIDLVLPPPSLKTLPESKQEALQKGHDLSPVLAGLQLKLRAADADIKAEKATWWPQVSMLAEKSTGALDEERLYVVAKTQLDAGLSSLSKVDSAIAKREAVVFEHENALKELTIRITETWNELVAARLRLKNSNNTSQMAQLVFESYVRQFSIGQKSWMDVLNATREASQARITVEDASSEVGRAELTLMILTDEKYLH